MTDISACLMLFQQAMKRKPQLDSSKEKLIADFIVTYVLTHELEKSVSDDLNILMIAFRTRHSKELDEKKIKNCIKKIRNKIKLEDNEKLTLRELAVISDMASLLMMFNRLHRLNILKSNSALGEIYKKLKHCDKFMKLLDLHFYAQRPNLALRSKMQSNTYLRDCFTHLKELDILLLIELNDK